MEYKPLTKKVVLDGKECITCSLYDAADCKIHTLRDVNNCWECPILQAIYNQLYEFEKVYMEGE